MGILVDGGSSPKEFFHHRPGHHEADRRHNAQNNRKKTQAQGASGQSALIDRGLHNFFPHEFFIIGRIGHGKLL